MASTLGENGMLFSSYFPLQMISGSSGISKLFSTKQSDPYFKVCQIMPPFYSDLESQNKS
ncbi:hypothetical protein LEMLEM_LOCUS22181 [Lemmus lemmus]